MRILCFLIITPWQIGIILSANYTFLNYLVLALGLLLLDDQFVLPCLPGFVKRSYLVTKVAKPLAAPALEGSWWKKLGKQLSALRLAVTAVMLTWIFYATLVQLVWMVKPWPLPATPVSMLEPFRVANRYGLFAIMTRGRYEIEVGRWTKLGGVSLPVQTARSEQSAGNLRAVSAAIRLEFVVCISECVAAGANRCTDRAEFASRGYGRAFAFCGQPLPAWSAARGARSNLAILVHDAGRKTYARHVVETEATRPLRSYVRTRIRWKSRCPGVADG
jgi:hypothetical protein